MTGQPTPADALRAELAHMTEARDNARAEVERLSARVEAVRALHQNAPPPAADKLTLTTLPSGDHIASEDHDRTLTTTEGQRYHSTSYGPWEPIFPDQTCPGCGLEHPGEDCREPDLFGGAL